MSKAQEAGGGTIIINTAELEARVLEGNFPSFFLSRDYNTRLAMARHWEERNPHCCALLSLHFVVAPALHCGLWASTLCTFSFCFKISHSFLWLPSNDCVNGGPNFCGKWPFKAFFFCGGVGTLSLDCPSSHCLFCCPSLSRWSATCWPDVMQGGRSRVCVCC